MYGFNYMPRMRREISDKASVSPNCSYPINEPVSYMTADDYNKLGLKLINKKKFLVFQNF